MRSLMRFYTQFTDEKKHSAINSLVTPTSRKPKDRQLVDGHKSLVVSFEVEEEPARVHQTIIDYLKKKHPTLLVYFVFVNQEVGLLDKFKSIFKDKK